MDCQKEDWCMDQASILTKQNEQENMEELQGYGQRRGMKWALQCLDLLSFASDEELSYKSCLAHQSVLLLKTQTWQFQLCKKTLRATLRYSWEISSSMCSSSQNVIMMMNKREDTILTLQKNIDLHLWPLHLKRNMVEFEKGIGNGS